MRPVRPAAVRLELVPVGPIDVKPDPWQRLVAIGSILSVLVVSVGLYLTNKANREQQITDRFTKAVEQLGQPGPEKVDVRLGGIYALERIMRDSAVDHPAVVSVLTAFIRVHAPVDPATIRSPKPTSQAGEATSPPVDIQAAITVLGRRDTTRDQDPLDLTRANLTRADLTGATLTGANLAGANLTGANLTGATLTGATLTSANLTSANLARANLTSANLTSATLDGANLFNTTLDGANLFNTNLTGTILFQCGPDPREPVCPDR